MSKSGKPKSGQAKMVLRREELRRSLPKPGFDPRVLLEKPEFVNAMLLAIAFVIVTSSLLIYGREHVLVRDGQVMTTTQLKRLDYQVIDDEATETAREEARKSSPRIYRQNEAYLQRLSAALVGLPQAVAGKASVEEEISDELRQQFQLTNVGLTALQPMAVDGEPTIRWQRFVEDLINNQLRYRPLIDSEEYQLFSTTYKRALIEENQLELLHGDAIELTEDTEALTPQLTNLATRAGFPHSISPFIVSRLLWEPEPTLQFDAYETDRFAQERADQVSTIMVEHHQGEVLFRKGDLLTPAQYESVKTEAEFFAAHAPPSRLWLPRLGTIGLVLLITALLSSLMFINYPRVVKNTLRLVALGLLIDGMIAITVIVSSQSPTFLIAAAIAPTLFVVIVVMLAYDQRLALFSGIAQAIMTAIALSQGVGFALLLAAGSGTMIIQLQDVRNRNSIIRAAVVTAAVLGFGYITLGLFTTPMVEGVWPQIMLRTLAAVLASFGVGFLILGILPSIERLFDITTGMTLAELRDPKQPLLRQLQQKAPGTYNHSLQVANIAEAATDAIGGDGLLVYVGALYHDIGKMNKPEYFVENQTDGYNKHSKLRPTMSQLVIVGHVKDGIELAREYNLPRSLLHFIESHHGTTLVEYFYHAAKTQAESEDKESVEEVSFRYPGPKPQTREAAILMLADAVESATRALTEPNPGRIEGLVHQLSHKRLMDGQFSNCDLTFRELNLIEDAMISRLCAIHHGRISYPTESKAESDEQDETPAAETASA